MNNADARTITTAAMDIPAIIPPANPVVKNKIISEGKSVFVGTMNMKLEGQKMRMLELGRSDHLCCKNWMKKKIVRTTHN